MLGPAPATTFATRTLSVEDQKGILLHPWPMRIVVSGEFLARIQSHVEISPDGQRMAFEFANALAGYRLESLDPGSGVGIWRYINGEFTPPSYRE